MENKKLKFPQDDEEQLRLSPNISKDDSRSTFLKLKTPKIYMPSLNYDLKKHTNDNSAKIKNFKEDENFKNQCYDFSKEDRESCDAEQSRKLFISDKIVIDF
jgi:hypothetical protein